MKLKHELLIAFVVCWFVLRTIGERYVYRYLFTEAILVLDAIAFIATVYLVFERKNL